MLAADAAAAAGELLWADLLENVCVIRFFLLNGGGGCSISFKSKADEGKGRRTAGDERKWGSEGKGKSGSKQVFLA